VENLWNEDFVLSPGKKQIPFGDDNKRSKDNNSKSKRLRMRSLTCLTLYFYCSEPSGINM
jgi:hypothetical protein